ncbi:MAG: hypothetical protein GY953_13185 [bacterium]|nr:hypothetical protein [bacterium]
MKQWSRRALLAGGVFAPLGWGASWDKKPYQQWNDDEVRRVLTNSPWASSKEVPLDLDGTLLRGVERWKDVPVPGTRRQPSGVGPDYGHGSPVGGIGAGKPKVPTQAALTILWASALPIKQAMVRTKSRGGQMDTQQANQILEKDESDYVVEVYGLPALVAYSGVGVVQAEVFRTAYLSTKTGKVIRAGSVYVPVRGAKLVITMRFPRTEPITEKDGWVEAFAKGGVFEFRQRFPIKAMKYRGKLEL